MIAVELFAGAGGLALGSMAAGFSHAAVIEWNKNACQTLRKNRELGRIDWPIHQCDVREFDFRPYEGAELLAGGPPCQPFSIGGKHRGEADHRNMFPEALRAVREIQPKFVLLENVKGLLRESFSDFFDYVVLQLRFPEIRQLAGEDWPAHLDRLRSAVKRPPRQGLRYDVSFRKLNAADYGVPQRRERVFIVASRSDLNITWRFPTPTHSQDALLREQWVTGKYWERHEVSKKERGSIPSSFRSRVARLQQKSLLDEGFLPWRTVRDALHDLPEPDQDQRGIANHVLMPGARVYGGHTGSPIDEPAKTLKAGDHGVPGGENMLAFRDGRVRYFTVRESARLQTFPDDFVFEGSWTESMRQLGNAVAVDMGTLLASRIHGCLSNLSQQDSSDVTRGNLQPA
ncbi:MAG: DNA cytosine methyltransferase [Planctomycetaceae bacterium]